MTPASQNPFRVDRLDALRFRPHQPGIGVEEVVGRFRDAGWHGAVVGPHGTGKSTLLRTLADAAEADGCHVWRFFVNQSVPWRGRRPVPAAGARVWVLDGWCHLSPLRRLRLRRAARVRGAGILGTAHLCGWGLPTHHRTHGTPELLAGLVGELRPGGSAVDPEALLLQARGSVRDALFELYDREAERRPRG